MPAWQIYISPVHSRRQSGSEMGFQGKVKIESGVGLSGGTAGASRGRQQADGRPG